jgi:hypothetical protein
MTMEDKINAKSIVEWIDKGMTPVSNVAFTESENRKAAWLCEYAVAQEKEMRKFSPEAYCYDCQEADGNVLCDEHFCDCSCHTHKISQ